MNKLLTKKQEQQLINAYKNNLKINYKPKVFAKLFNPTGAGTWYLVEYNPESNYFFGLVHIHEWDLGYIYLDEIEKFRGQFGLGIERDKYFSPKPLKQIQEEIGFTTYTYS